MASYPNSVKTFTTHADNVGEYILAAHINDIQAEVVAMETQLETSKLAKLADLSGWIPVSDTWTYASANTITVPSGAASIYSVGMGIRLTANSQVLQAYIVKVQDTLLTVAGDALTNYAFSAKSYTPTPQTAMGFPGKFAFTPTVTWYGTTGGNPIAVTHTANFSLIGRQVNYWITTDVTNRGTCDAYIIMYYIPAVPTVGAKQKCFCSLVSADSANAEFIYGRIDISPSNAGRITQNGSAAVHISGLI